MHHVRRRIVVDASTFGHDVAAIEQAKNVRVRLVDGGHYCGVLVDFLCASVKCQSGGW